MFKIGHGNVQSKIKTVQSIRILVVAKIGSKFILSVSNFERLGLNSFNVCMRQLYLSFIYLTSR